MERMDLSFYKISFAQVDAWNKKIETLFTPVWELDLSEEIIKFLSEAGIFLSIQLCRMPKLRGADPACHEAVRQALKKFGLDFGMKARLLSDQWFPRDSFRCDYLDQILDKSIDIFVRYFRFVCEEEARLDLPELSVAEKQLLRRRVKEDSRRGLMFSPSGRSLLETPLAWDAEEYTIPYGVAVIGCKAFIDQASLKKVVIPDTVVKIDRSAFNGCLNLTEIEVSDRDFELATSAFDQVPGRKFLPPSLQTYLKAAMDVPDRGWKTYRNDGNFSPTGVVKRASDFLRGIDWFSGLPDTVPVRTELDRRLNVLLSVPIREGHKLNIFSIGISIHPLVTMLKRSPYLKKLYYHCPDCGKVSIFTIDPENSDHFPLAHLRELREMARVLRQKGLDARLEEPRLCPHCHAADAVPLYGAPFLWHVRRDGRESSFKLDGWEPGAIKEFLAARTEEDYANLIEEGNCAYISHTWKFEDILSILGFRRDPEKKEKAELENKRFRFFRMSFLKTCRRWGRAGFFARFWRRFSGPADGRDIED